MNQRPFISTNLNIFDENRCVFSPSTIGGQPVMVSQEQNRKIFDTMTTAISSNQPRIGNCYYVCQQQTPPSNQPWSCALQAQKQGVPGGVLFNFSQPNYCCPPSCIPSAYTPPPPPVPQIVECPYRTPQAVCVDFGKFGLEAMMFQQKCRQQSPGFTYDKQVGTCDQFLLPRCDTCCCGTQSVTLTADQKHELLHRVEETDGKQKLKVCSLDRTLEDNRRCICFPKPNPEKFGCIKTLVIGERKERCCRDCDIVEQARREVDAEAYLCCDCMDKWKQENMCKRPSCLKKYDECGAIKPDEEPRKYVSFSICNRSLVISENKKTQECANTCFSLNEKHPTKMQIKHLCNAEVPTPDENCCCGEKSSEDEFEEARIQCDVIRRINHLKKKKKGLVKMSSFFNDTIGNLLRETDHEIEDVRKLKQAGKGTKEQRSKSFKKPKQQDELKTDTQSNITKTEEKYEDNGNTEKLTFEGSKIKDEDSNKNENKTLQKDRINETYIRNEEIPTASTSKETGQDQKMSQLENDSSSIQKETSENENSSDDISKIQIADSGKEETFEENNEMENISPETLKHFNDIETSQTLHHICMCSGTPKYEKCKIKYVKTSSIDCQEGCPGECSMNQNKKTVSRKENYNRYPEQKKVMLENSSEENNISSEKIRNEKLTNTENKDSKGGSKFEPISDKLIDDGKNEISEDMKWQNTEKVMEKAESPTPKIENSKRQNFEHSKDSQGTNDETDEQDTDESEEDSQENNRWIHEVPPKQIKCHNCTCQIDMKKPQTKENLVFQPCICGRNPVSKFGKYLSDIYSATRERINNFMTTTTNPTPPIIYSDHHNCNEFCYKGRMNRYVAQLDKCRKICPCRFGTNKYCGKTCYDDESNQWYSCHPNSAYNEQNVVQITFRETSERRIVRLENRCRHSQYHVIYE